ncbi:MAG: hypothetical protein ABSG36_17835 [Acidimicrobiales bacterium]
MRGFLILTAAVLLVIGVGVAILRALPENPGPVACSSVRDCMDIARAYGIQNPLVTPTNPDLRFEDGLFFPRSRWLGWTVFLDFGNAQRIETLTWRIDSDLAVPTAPCHGAPGQVWLEAGGLRFCDVGDSILFFANDHVQYMVVDYSPPQRSAAATRRVWLMRQLDNLRSW